MKFTDGLFLSTFREVAKDTGIEPWEAPVDATCMGLVQRPEEWDVLVLPNLYGDILSDLTAGMVGGLGVAPCASIGTSAAVFEATHGSAPKYKGQNKVNPTAMILSGKLMLADLGEDAAAAAGRRGGRGDRRGQVRDVDLKPTRTDPTAVGTSEPRTPSSRSSRPRSDPLGQGLVVGAGFYGSTTAEQLADYDIFEAVALVDIIEASRRASRWTSTSPADPGLRDRAARSTTTT